MLYGLYPALTDEYAMQSECVDPEAQNRRIHNLHNVLPYHIMYTDNVATEDTTKPA